MNGLYNVFIFSSQELGRISLKSATKNFMKEFREKLNSRLKKKVLALILGIGPILTPLYLENELTDLTEV
jgi:hypothetical protein